ncbi:MAG: cytochrome c biogenesis protein CcdA [Synechococcus sp.]
MSFSLADLAQASEQLLRSGLEHPTPLTLVLVFAGGLLTSLGPCSLSLLPVSVAYLAGFGEGPAWQRSAGFCSGVVGALVILGTASATPVLAVLLAWISQSGKPLVGMVLLSCFGAGQVLPLLLAGSLAASIPKLLALRAVSQWIPPISGAVLVAIGGLSLVSRLT